MQSFNKTNKPQKGFKIGDLSLEDKQRLVGAFAWLLQEDKKQNPALYEPKKTQSYD